MSMEDVMKQHLANIRQLLRIFANLPLELLGYRRMTELQNGLSLELQDTLFDLKDCYIEVAFLYRIQVSKDEYEALQGPLLKNLRDVGFEMQVEPTVTGLPQAAGDILLFAQARYRFPIEHLPQPLNEERAALVLRLEKIAQLDTLRLTLAETTLVQIEEHAAKYSQFCQQLHAGVREQQPSTIEADCALYGGKVIELLDLPEGRVTEQRWLRPA